MELVSKNVVKNMREALEEGGVFYLLPENIKNMTAIYVVTVAIIQPNGSVSECKYNIKGSGRKEAGEKAVIRAKQNIPSKEVNLYKFDIMDIYITGN